MELRLIISNSFENRDPYICTEYKTISQRYQGAEKYTGYIFYMISGSQDISKTIWGIRFQEFEIMNHLIS